MKLKEGIALLIFIIILGFTFKHVGFAVQTPSSVSIPGVCGNGFCDWDEDCNTCSEDCGECVIPEEPSEGGGGTSPEAPITSVSNFVIDKDFIKILIKQGENQREIIEIKNIGTTPLNISISFQEIEKFVIASEENFSLSAGETKIINLDFFAKENEIPDSYSGRIIIKSNSTEKIINTVIEIKEKYPLFDISLKVLNEIVYSKEEVKANIRIINMGELENIDVLLYYALKDFNNTILSFEEESIAVIGKELIVKRSLIPNLPEGQYIFYVKVSYGEISATASDVFYVSKKESVFISYIKENPLAGGILIIIIFLIIVYFLIMKKIKKKLN